MRTVLWLGATICLCFIACKTSDGVPSSALKEQPGDAGFGSYLLFPFLGAYAGGGTNTGQAVKVTTALRDVPADPEKFVGAVKITTTIGSDVGSQKLDYSMLFTDAQTFQVVIGSQQVGVGRCQKEGTGLICPISIPALGYSETFTFTRQTAVASTVKAKGSTNQNGVRTNWEYDLIGNWPGFTCTGFHPANNSPVTLTVAADDTKKIVAVFNELKPLNDLGATFSIAWSDLTITSDNEGTSYDLERLSAGYAAVIFHLNLGLEANADGLYDAQWEIAAGNSNGSISFSAEAPMPMLCVKNR